MARRVSAKWRAVWRERLRTGSGLGGDVGRLLLARGRVPVVASPLDQGAREILVAASAHLHVL